MAVANPPSLHKVRRGLYCRSHRIARRAAEETVSQVPEVRPDNEHDHPEVISKAMVIQSIANPESLHDEMNNTNTRRSQVVQQPGKR